MKLSPQMLFVSGLLYYSGLLVSPHKFVVVLVSVIYLLWLWRATRDFRQALMLMYLALVPIRVGKLIPIELISALALDIPGRAFGVSADIIITLSDAVIACMAMVLMFSPRVGRLYVPHHRWMAPLLVLYPVSHIIATLFGSVRPDASLLHALHSAQPLILYYFFSSFAVPPLWYAMSILSGAVILEALVVAGQVIVHGPLGLVIEALPSYLAVDLSRESAGLLRYSGTYPHANELAHALLLLVFFLLPSLWQRTRWGTIFIRSFFAGLITLAATMSRSALFALALGISSIWVLRKYVGDRGRFAYTMSPLLRWVVYSMMGILTVVVTIRLVSTLDSNRLYGSLETRRLLFSEYSETLKIYPVFGVGLGMDVYVQHARSMAMREREADSANRSAVLYFPEPVHNGFLRLLIQTGLVGTVPYLSLLIGLVATIWNETISKGAMWRRRIGVSLVAGILAVSINSLMQPLLPDLSLLTVLAMLYLPHKT